MDDRADFLRRIERLDREVSEALKQEDERYLARCRYEFPNKELSPTARVVLIVRDANGRQTSAFTIDLAAMR